MTAASGTDIQTPAKPQVAAATKTGNWAGAGSGAAIWVTELKSRKLDREEKQQAIALFTDTKIFLTGAMAQQAAAKLAHRLMEAIDDATIESSEKAMIKQRILQANAEEFSLVKLADTFQNLPEPRDVFRRVLDEDKEAMDPQLRDKLDAILESR